MTEDNPAHHMLTEQEVFWKGSFGAEYTERNSGRGAEARAVANMAKGIAKAQRPIRSVLELGANRGLNIRALQLLLPEASFDGVEINEHAAKLLARTGCQVEHASLLDYEPKRQFDLVVVSGVLIHVNPMSLSDAYRVIAAASSQYVLISEYYNPVPVEVEYRGHGERLFKRDFAGEFLDQHPTFRLCDYGFIYHRDAFPADDSTWFLLERKI